MSRKIIHLRFPQKIAVNLPFITVENYEEAEQFLKRISNINKINKKHHVNEGLHFTSLQQVKGEVTLTQMTYQLDCLSIIFPNKCKLFL
jgi:hypothetical protein